MSKLHTILFSRDLKIKKVRYPHPHPYPRNKTKIFGIKSEMLIKDKRIKWTLAVRLRTYSQGDKIISIQQTLHKVCLRPMDLFNTTDLLRNYHDNLQLLEY